MKLIFEYSQENVSGHVISLANSSRKTSLKRSNSRIERDIENVCDPIDDGLLRDGLLIPDLSEPTVVRHYTNLSRLNYGIDVGFYPLGSCTMKYNPRINETISSLAGFKDIHPYSPPELVQGSLRIMWELEQYLKVLTGMDSFSLQPSAGSQAEFLGLLISRKYFADRNETQRCRVIIPDSAHGSNPASASMAGYQIISIPTDSRGNMDFTVFEKTLDNTVAVIMLTNPNTLGLYEENIRKISDTAHKNGSLMYCDGANMNALLGITMPAEQGFDMIHLNLHKTFSAPHGGGGPGAGALGVRSFLSQYLPVPRIVKRQLDDTLEGGSDVKKVEPRTIKSDHLADDKDSGFLQKVSQAERERYRFCYSAPTEDSNEKKLCRSEVKPKIAYEFDYVGDGSSVGRLKCFYGNFGTILRAYSYIRSWGLGIKNVSEGAILNANYLLSLLTNVYELPYKRPCAHEFVLTTKKFGDRSALAIAKRLLDYGYHPPTIYFPLIVREAFMIEPTETESKQTLDEFAGALIKIASELETNPDIVMDAPQTTYVGRLDEVNASRNPNLRWDPRST